MLRAPRGLESTPLTQHEPPSNVASRSAETSAADATVPSLHELCSRVISDCLLTPKTVCEVMEFARTYNVPMLQRRVEAFVTSAWVGVQEVNDAETLRRVLGDELYTALCAEQEELARATRRLSLVGEVVEKPVPPNAVLEPARTQSGRDTWPYEQLRTGVAWPPGVVADERERWLSNEQFEAVLGVSREAWAKLPEWKKGTLRREADLF